MSDLIGALIAIFAFSSFLKAIKRKKQSAAKDAESETGSAVAPKRQSGPKSWNPANPSTWDSQSWREVFGDPFQATPRKEEKRPQPPSPAPMTSMASTYRPFDGEGSTLGEGYGGSGSLGFSPLGEGYTGSLGVSSMEGMDDCDPTLEHGRRLQFAPLPQFHLDAEPKPKTLPLAWNRDSVIQGVVMSEILARPAQRKMGRR